MGNKRELIFGFGINDLDYNMFQTYEGGVCKLGQAWRDIIKRAYSEKFKIKRKEYEDTTVSEDWLNASNFVNWAKTKNFNGMVIDKDLIVFRNKNYSKDLCCWISPSLNGFLSTNKKINNKLIGATKIGNCYQSMISLKGKRYYLGRFKTEIDAHVAYRMKKAEMLRDFKKDFVDLQIIDAIEQRANLFEDISCTI